MLGTDVGDDFFGDNFKMLLTELVILSPNIHYLLTLTKEQKRICQDRISILVTSFEFAVRHLCNISYVKK